VQHLRSKLDRVDRKGYGAYKDLQGSYDLEGFTLLSTGCNAIRSPRLPWSGRGRERTASIPRSSRSPVRRVAFEDFLTRSVERELRRAVKGNRGSGGAGGSRYNVPRRSSCRARRGRGAGARRGPYGRRTSGQGRTVDARAARTMLLEELPRVVREALTPAGGTRRMPRRTWRPPRTQIICETTARARTRRFLGGGSGASAGERGERPAAADGAVRSEVPEEFRVAVELPNGVPSPVWAYRRGLRSWRGAGSTESPRCSRRSPGDLRSRAG
jgi:hypothetical protein